MTYSQYAVAACNARSGLVELRHVASALLVERQDCDFNLLLRRKSLGDAPWNDNRHTMKSNYRAHLIQDGRETSNGELAGLSMTRNIGTSSRLAVMCGFAVGHILRSLERREVVSDEVSPWAFPQPVQQFLLAFVGQCLIKPLQ